MVSFFGGLARCVLVRKIGAEMGRGDGDVHPVTRCCVGDGHVGDLLGGRRLAGLVMVGCSGQVMLIRACVGVGASLAVSLWLLGREWQGRLVSLSSCLTVRVLCL